MGSLIAAAANSLVAKRPTLDAAGHPGPSFAATCAKIWAGSAHPLHWHLCNRAAVDQVTHRYQSVRDIESMVRRQQQVRVRPPRSERSGCHAHRSDFPGLRMARAVHLTPPNPDDRRPAVAQHRAHQVADARVPHRDVALRRRNSRPRGKAGASPIAPSLVVTYPPLIASAPNFGLPSSASPAPNIVSVLSTNVSRTMDVPARMISAPVSKLSITAGNPPACDQRISAASGAPKRMPTSAPSSAPQRPTAPRCLSSSGSCWPPSYPWRYALGRVSNDLGWLPWREPCGQSWLAIVPLSLPVGLSNLDREQPGDSNRNRLACTVVSRRIDTTVGRFRSFPYRHGQGSVKSQNRKGVSSGRSCSTRGLPASR